jgi:hypothetical protein
MISSTAHPTHALPDQYRGKSYCDAMGPGRQKTSEGFLNVAEECGGRDCDGRYRCESE